MKASEFDKAFDEGHDIDHAVDWSSVRRPNVERRRVELTVPSWMAETVDAEAQRRGVTSETLIEQWIAERIG